MVVAGEGCPSDTGKEGRGVSLMGSLCVWQAGESGWRSGGRDKRADGKTRGNQAVIHQELSDDEPSTADLDDFTMRRVGGVSCDRWHEDDFVPPPRKKRVWGSDEEGGGSQCGSEAVETDSERQDEADDGEASGEETWSDVAADQSSGKHLFALTMDS